jgi:3-mercaptopyruvate sulfurtransferase SseA/N-acetylneuraminic acid mutarotase
MRLLRMRSCPRELSGLVFVLLFGALLAGCSRSSTEMFTGIGGPGPSGWHGQPGGDLLWSVDRLHDEIHSQVDFVLIDARFDVADFDAGHIAGAIWIDWRELANNPPATFPPSAVVEQFLGQQRGLEITDRIVIYGDGGLRRQAPFRLFWMLEYYGCADVHIVDGGFGTWVQAGYGVDKTPWNPNVIVPGSFVAAENSFILATAAEIQDFVENRETTDKVVIDARTAWEFSGEAAEIFQDRAGRIPYSTRVSWLDGIDPGTGELVAPERVRKLLADAGVEANRDNIVVATTGVRSTAVYFFCRLFGLPCRVYQGGLHDWSDVDNPPLGDLGLIERTGPFNHKSVVRGDLRPHFAGASAVYHDLIFTFGGLTCNPTNPPSTVNSGMWVFNPATDPKHEGVDRDNWAEVTPAATAPRFGHAAVTVPSENTIYIFGGATDTRVFRDIYRCVIDPVTHDIHRITKISGVSLPRNLYGLSAVYNDADGLIYLFGGSSVIPFIGASDRAYVFTPAAMGGPAIAEIASLPLARTRCGGVALKGKIYCLGGEDLNNVILDEVLEYDPNLNAWVVVESMNLPRLGVKGAVANGRIYMAGGISEDGGSDFTTGLVESYDPDNHLEGWTGEGEMTIPRSHCFMESVDDVIYMLGGYKGPRNLAVNSINFLNAVEYRPDRRVFRTALPAPLHSGGTAELNGKIYLFGGNQSGTVTSKVLVYDPVADVYTEMDPIPYGPVRDAGVVAIGGRALVFGGAADHSLSGARKAACLFDPLQSAGNQWTRVSDMPVALFGAASACYNDASRSLGFGTDLVFVIGGNDINGEATAVCTLYDVADDAWHGSVLGDLPGSRSWAAAAVIEDVVCLTGGADADGRPLPDTLALDLDPVSATYLLWKFLGAMPTARYGHAGFTLGNEFCNIGGFGSGGGERYASDAVEVLDVATGRWSRLSGLDDAMAFSFAAAAPNAAARMSIYVIGGYVDYPAPVHFDSTIEMTH